MCNVCIKTGGISYVARTKFYYRSTASGELQSTALALFFDYAEQLLEHRADRLLRSLER